jgi:hypothetical protein
MTAREGHARGHQARSADPQIKAHGLAPRLPDRNEDAATGREQEKVAAQPDSPVTEAVSSLEVRWIFPGPVDPMVAGWFARFPARMTSYEDSYLLDPDLPGLSVKIRGGRISR